MVVASPVVFYFAITRARLHEAALLILAFAALRALPVLLASKREHLWAALRLPIVAVLSAAFGLVTGEPRALLVLPSLSQLAFAGVFLASLRSVPLVEHFARMQKHDLRPAQVRYCRTVTLVWAVVLSTAALVGLALAAWAPLAVWTAFTAVGSYVLVAVVFSVEYLVRKIRFREYGRMPVDRILSKLFPALSEQPASSTPPESDIVRDLDLGMGTEAHAEVSIPRDYVFFRGHFEKAPMLPGVTQLTELVLPIVRRRHPNLGGLRQLRRVRFRRPVLPGETVRVSIDELAPRADVASCAPANIEEVRFELRVGDSPVASGVMAFDATRSAP